jgi:hypothetical protein
LDPPDLVRRAGTYSIVEDMMHTKANITYGQLLGNLAIRKDLRKSLIPKKKIPRSTKAVKRARASHATITNETTPLTCTAKCAGYNFKLILDSGSSVSVISKHFLEAIARNIDEASK